MWTYSQSTGFLLDKTETRIAICYAGRGEGKNNHLMEAVHGIGPLPCGYYIIGQPHDHPDLGPFAIPLTPDPANEMHGRSGFYMHGDSKSEPGNASHGCICAPRTAREKVWKSDDLLLHVIP